MKIPGWDYFKDWKLNNLLLHKRWPWHLFFWIGYALFRFWPYYITVTYFPRIFLHYMLLSEIMFVVSTYFTVWLYERLFDKKKYLLYFIAGTISWLFYLYVRTEFQFSYLQNERRFQGNTITDILINNIAIVVVSFLFITACKYFKDGYIKQHFETKKKQQQLLAEVNNLKSQIAPHFLFNTLNNLYGLAVEKSDKLPDLMLRLSNLLRHSLYETQKPLVPLNEEINVLKSYIELETVRLEDDLKLEFENLVPSKTSLQIAPLILIVFIENSFKHAKLVKSSAVDIYIKTMVENDLFTLILKNNYNAEVKKSENGIGLTNVIRRLEVLYPNGNHQLTIHTDDNFFTIILQLHLLDKVKFLNHVH